MTGINHLMEALGRYAIAWSWQTALLIVFVWIVLRFDRRHRPDLRYRLLALTLALSVVLPWVTAAVASFNWTVQLKSVWLQPLAADTVSVPVLTSLPARPLAESRVRSAAAPPAQSGSFFAAIGFVWCIGAGIAAARRLHRHVRFAGIVKRAETSWFENSPLPILLSKEVSGPMLYGLWRPVILLPRNIADWSTPEERLSMVHHECAHFARMDHWASIVEGFLRTIFFFHPMFRWLCGRLDIEREILCDAAVVRRGSTPEVYTKALLNAAEYAVIQPGGVHFAAAAALNERIELLLMPHKPMRASLSVAGLVLFMPLVALGFSQSVVPALETVETGWVLRFLPAVPLMEPVSTRTARRMSVQPPQQPTVLRSSVMVLRGQGAENDVRVNLAIPYSILTFGERTTLNGSSVHRASATISITVETLTGGEVTRRENPIEIDVPRQLPAEGIAICQEALLLAPGSYRVVVQVNDKVAGSRTPLDQRFEVPRLRGTGLEVSSLIVSDFIGVNPPRAANRPFVIGNLRVRPSVTRRFRSNQELNVFQQVYSDGSGPVDVEIQIRTANNRILKRVQDRLQPASQIDVAKTIPLSDIPSGSYIVQTAIVDTTTGTGVVSSEDFIVE